MTGQLPFQGFMINFKPFYSLPSFTVSSRTKATVLSLTIGITLLGFLARLLRRRKRRKTKPSPVTNPFSGRRTKHGSNWSLTNGDVTPMRTGVSPSMFRTRLGSVSSDRQSVHSLLAPSVNMEISGAPTTLTPQQLGTMGMEALETAIAYWEDALAAYRPPPGDLLALTDVEEGNFTHVLEKMLDEAYKLQEYCSHLFLNESSVLFKEDTVSLVSSRYDRQSQSDHRTITTMSSIESFVSAQAEVANLDDFDEFNDLNLDLKELHFYQAACKKYEEGAIAVRLLRTEMVNCQTSMEYISKVYCMRIAFKALFEKESVRKWFFDLGYKVLGSLMWVGEKDPKDCLIAYENIVEYAKDDSNWPDIEEELRSRDVKEMTFYDIVIDFIVLDAFEDLEKPPSSVTAVIQNRWLSTGFKETALTTAVWSVFKAKRRMLKFSDGFISHLYSVSEQLIPVLVWGFLGPNEKLRSVCSKFKEEVLGFVLDIFSFKKVRYTKIEDLTHDIMELAKDRFEHICEKLT